MNLRLLHKKFKMESKKDDEIFRKTFFGVKSLTETPIIWLLRNKICSVTKYFFLLDSDTRENVALKLTVNMRIQLQ